MPYIPVETATAIKASAEAYGLKIILNQADLREHYFEAILLNDDKHVVSLIQRASTPDTLEVQVQTSATAIYSYEIPLVQLGQICSTFAGPQRVPVALPSVEATPITVPQSADSTSVDVDISTTAPILFTSVTFPASNQ